MRIINLILVCLLFSSFCSFAQLNQANISFTELEHDFGKVHEEGGLVTFTFDFINTGAEALILSNVQASCGCTTPSWSKEPISPAGKGSIQVTYNPLNRPGSFVKKITVTSNAIESPMVLTIKGEVIPKPLSIEEQYRYAFGDLRLKEQILRFGILTPTDVKTMEVEVYNNTDKPFNLSFDKLPKHLQIKAVPENLQTKQSGKIIVTYDAKKKNDWGRLVDNVSVAVNNKIEPTKFINIEANIMDNFSKLTPEAREKSPKIEFTNAIANFDTIPEGASIDKIITFKNTGKENLIIRKIDPTCDCVIASVLQNTVKPGQEGTIKLTFNAKGRDGFQNIRLSVICNSPYTPEAIIWLKGIVKKK